MRAPIRKLGNSSGVIIPKPILSQIGVEAGDDLDLSLDEDRIVLAPVKRNPRAGWADTRSALLRREMMPQSGLNSGMRAIQN